jgi:hypothetical protein
LDVFGKTSFKNYQGDETDFLLKKLNVINLPLNHRCQEEGIIKIKFYVIIFLSRSAKNNKFQADEFVYHAGMPRTIFQVFSASR